VFLTVGVPRWLTGDDAPVPTHTNTFARLCRDHGGRTAAHNICTVRYGERVYRMDAISPHGVDEDAARYQRQGCEEAQREQPTEHVYIYHRTTGVCERRS
jgi:hypothetical protein